MSNFLDNFSGKKYEKLLDEKDNKPSVKEDVSNKHEANTKPNQPKGKRIDTVEEINKDPNYQKKKILQHGLLVAAVLIVVVGGIFFYRTSKERTLPNFVNKPISEVQSWAKQNSIELDINSEYSMKVDKDNVISMSEKSGKKLHTGDVLKVKVSDGANLEESLKLPDFSKYNETEIEAWIDKNKAYNLKVVKEYHATIEKSKFIKLEFSDKDMTNETYKRKDYATVYVSKGKETHKKDIEVPQFVDEDASKATEWASKNEIKLIKKEDYSASVETGKVISQSVAAKEKVAKKDEFTIVISKGKATVVPNFANYNLHTINETGSATGVTFTVVERYNASVPYGALISQSVAPGTIVEESDVDNVILVYSIGLPYLNRDDVVNKTEKDLRDFFFVENQKGANLTYTIKHVSPDTCTFKPAIKGSSCGSNYDNQFVQIGSHVIIYMANSDSPSE